MVTPVVSFPRLFPSLLPVGELDSTVISDFVECNHDVLRAENAGRDVRLHTMLYPQMADILVAALSVSVLRARLIGYMVAVKSVRTEAQVRVLVSLLRVRIHIAWEWDVVRMLTEEAENVQQHAYIALGVSHAARRTARDLFLLLQFAHCAEAWSAILREVD
jgi:hypothetical protein